MGLTGEAGTTYFVIVTHLLSQRSANDGPRAAQADAIAQAATAAEANFDHVIVLGDLNDQPGSETLQQIEAAGLRFVAGPDDFSYVFHQTPQFIDHILITDSLVVPGLTFDSFDLGPISDHRGVELRLP